MPMGRRDDEEKTFVSDKELLDALEAATKAEVSQDFPNKSLLTLLELVVNRLIETSDKFNEHGHPTQTRLSGDEYSTSGSGFAGAPAIEGSYACHDSIRIGQ